MCQFRRLDRSAKRGAERPCFNDKQLIGDRRSLRAALRALVETTEIATCDSPALHTGEVAEGRRGKASVEAPVHLRSVQSFIDGLDNRGGLTEHVAIPES